MTWTVRSGVAVVVAMLLAGCGSDNASTNRTDSTPGGTADTGGACHRPR